MLSISTNEIDNRHNFSHVHVSVLFNLANTEMNFAQTQVVMQITKLFNTEHSV